MILLLPSQSTVLNAYAVLLGMTPGNAAFKDHQAYIASATNAGYLSAVESYFAGTSTASLAATALTNLGLTSVFTQADAEAFLNANPGNRTGALIAAGQWLYSYSGSDVGTLAAKAAYVTAIESSYVYSNNAANVNGQAWVGVGGQTTTLTTGFDNLVGTALNDTYLARTIDNANTLDDRDMIDGGAGTDTLFVDFTALTNAITPVLKNIETVVIRAQTTTADATNGNNMTGAMVQLDAQRSLAVDNYDNVTAATGVTRWESNNSRSDVIIEDVRIGNSQKTKDITIAMVDTDPGNVDYGVYFDQLSLRNASSGNTNINIFLMDTAAAAATPATPLLNHNFNTYTFFANNVKVVLGGTGTAAGTLIDNATTYAALKAAFETALQTALVGGVVTNLSSSVTVGTSGSVNMTTEAAKSTESATVSANFLNLTGEIISLNASGSMSITSSSTTGEAGGWTASGPAPSTGAIVQTFNTGSVSTSELVTSTVVLDNVGRGSTGGDLLIGGLSVGETSTSRGVERFEITVNDNSKLQTINSTNNALREVTIVNGSTSNTVADAYTTTVTNAGNLTVNGNAKSSIGVDQGVTADNQDMDGVNRGASVVHQGANAAGFTDVRLIDGSTMTGQLAFTAAVTTDSIAKYVNRVDTAASPTADVAGTGNINFNVLGANFIYNGGTNNDTMVVNVDGAAAASRSSVLSGQSDLTFSIDGGSGNDSITFDLVQTTNTLVGGIESWANNQDLNNNIAISGGAGNDTIRTPGTGDIVIDAGAGNDYVYTDNTGRQTVADLNGAVGIVSSTTTSNGVWVYNTWDQVNAVANGSARNLRDLRSDANDSYNFYKGTLTVTFKGIPSAAITLANATTYKTTDLEINQAIKNAINTDATLSKLLVAQDGPANTLVVTSLIDGVMATTDLTVTFAAPVASTVYSATEIAGMATAYSNAGITTNALALAAQVLPSSKAAQNDYATQMAQDSAGLNIVGAASTSTSDNFVSPGTGNDIIVLGTTEGVDVARSSNEVVTLAAGFGNDVIVNFDATGNGMDHLNVGAFLTSTVATTVGALANTNSLVTVVAEAASTNDTLTLVTAIIKAAVDTATQATATKQVYIVYNAHNVGSVYSVSNGTAASDAVVTLEGTIDLADTTWAALSTAAHFSTVSATAEGASSAAVAALLTAVVNNQVLTGTSGMDTLNTGTMNGVTMTGGANIDLFEVAAGSTGSIITDLTTGDDFTVAAGGDVDALNVAAFVASSVTNNASGAAANADIRSAVAGSTINLAAATAGSGYLVTGAAGVDTITGSAGADTLNGDAGADVISGGAGNDAINGGTGADTLTGGDGTDTLTGGGGASVDTFNVTGTGTDTISGLGEGATADIIVVASNAVGTATLAAGDNFTATAGTTNAGFLTITADGGGSTIDMALAGGPNGYILAGAAGADTLTGSAFADTISSAAGGGTIVGGLGNDSITLGAGADTVQYAAGAGVDTIAAFTSGADFFDYTSGLVATTGATAIAAGAIATTMIQVTAVSAVTVMSAAANTVAAFEFESGGNLALALDFATASAASIQTAAETMLAGNFFAGTTAPMTASAISTDVLLVVYEAAGYGAGTDAAIFRYQEGAASEASFSGELTLVGVLTGVAQDALVPADII